MLLICLLFYFLRFINTAHPMGLNMIVKNETPVLGRLFNSVKDIISYYVIVETGSTDGTPEFIKNWIDAPPLSAHPMTVVYSL